MPAIDLYPKIVERGGVLRTAILSGNQNPFPIVLAAIGSVQVITLQYLQRFLIFDNPGGFTDNVTGETATRTLTKEFATSSDGVTYSVYLPITDSNLQAIVHDSDLPFYFRLRYTRGGTDVAGNIQIRDAALLYSVDTLAIGEYGAFSTEYFMRDLIEYIQDVTETQVLNFNGAPAFDVRFANRMNCIPGAKPIIYFNSLNFGEEKFITTDSFVRNISFRMGIRGYTDNRDDKQIEMISVLTELWGHRGNYRTFSINFKGVQNNAVTHRNFGIQDMDSGTVIQLPETSSDTGQLSNYYGLEFEARFAIKFTSVTYPL